MNPRVHLVALAALLASASSCTDRSSGRDSPLLPSAAPSASTRLPARKSENDLVVGGSHACLLRPNGTAQCWGSNRLGQLGDGTNRDHRGPIEVTNASNIAQLALGSEHTCALTHAGKVVCWGGQDEELVGGKPLKPFGPVSVSLVEPVVELTAGYAHTCALNARGEIRCWGRYVDKGNSSLNPVRVWLRERADRIVAGGDGTCALLDQGKISCWGAGAVPVLVGSKFSRRIPDPSLVAGLDGVVDLTLSSHHGCVVRRSGKVQCWGRNNDGQIGLGTTSSDDDPLDLRTVPGIESVAQIASSYNGSTCVRLWSGAVQCWGFNRDGQVGDGTQSNRPSPVTVQDLQQAADIGLGHDFSCALTANNGVACWGGNRSGELGQPAESFRSLPGEVPKVAGAATVACGHADTCAALKDGAVQCWGALSADDPVAPAPVPGFADIAALSLGQAGRAARNTKGTAFCWEGASGKLLECGPPPQRPMPEPDSSFQQIAFGYSHGCALSVSKRVSCWGSDHLGRVGNYSGRGTATRPREVPGVGEALAIAVGADESCALRADGTVLCWGSPTFPGIGTETEPRVVYLRPTKVPAIADAVSLAHGRRHGCVVVKDGSVLCWGRNDYGQLGQAERKTSVEARPVPGLSAVEELALGGFFSCARRKDGKVLCWGDNALGQLGDGSTDERFEPREVARLQEVVALSAGYTHACAVTRDGKVLCWGSNASGELGTGLLRRSLTPLPVSAR